MATEKVYNLRKTMYNVGDKVYLVGKLSDIFQGDMYKQCNRYKHPLERRVTEITKAKDGMIKYNTAEGYFNNSIIGKYAYNTYADAQERCDELATIGAKAIDLKLEARIKEV